MNIDKAISILTMIQNDMQNDARDFDGKPFNGKTVATYFGNQGAAIAAIAQITKEHIEEFQQYQDK